MREPSVTMFIEEQIRIYYAMIAELERDHPQLPGDNKPIAGAKSAKTPELENLKASRRTLQAMLV